MSDLLRSLAAGAPAAQERLDKTYLERLSAAGALSSRLPAGWEGLGASLIPARPLLTEVSIETRFRFTESAGEELALGVELLSLGFRRRFAYSGFTSNTATLVVRQVPLATAGDPRTGKSSNIP